MRGEPDRSGGEELSAEPRGPGRRVGVGLDPDVERRLAQCGLGDAARGLGAIGGCPPLPQPVRDVETHAILAGENVRPALGDAPQHGVDEFGEAMRPAVAPRGLDGEIDDRVRGHAETDELGGAGEQDRPQAALVGRQRPLEEAPEHELELALPAQRGRCHRPRQRPVAGLQRGMLGPRRLLRQHLLQRPLVHEHAGDEVHGKLPCREPGVAGPDARFLLPSSHAQCSPSPDRSRSRVLLQ